MIARSPATSSADSGEPRRAVEEGGVGRRGAVERQRDQHGALALDQVVAGGLAGGRRVAVHAEQVVAELERLAERQAVRRQLPQHVAVSRRRARRRCGAAARSSTWRTCSAAPSSRCRRPRGRGPGRTRRGTGRRSPRSGTGRTPRARAPPGRRAARSVAAARRTTTAAGRRAGSPRRRRTAPGRRATRPPGAPRRRCGASPAGRGGCPRRPCSRRGPGRWRAAAPGRRTRGPARPRPRRPAGTARWPHQQNDARNRFPPDTDVRASASSAAASRPERRDASGLLVEEAVEDRLEPVPERAVRPTRLMRRG